MTSPPRPPRAFLRAAAINRAFRRVLGTVDGWQWVAMRLPRGTRTGREVHRALSQVFHPLAGEGWLSTDGGAVPLEPGRVALVEPGTWHDLGAAPGRALVLLVGYSHQQHPRGLVQRAQP